MSLTSGPIVIIYLVVAAFVALWIYRIYRRKKVAEVAESLGLEFECKADLMHKLRDFELTRQGHSRKFENCMTGEANETVIRVFEYRFSAGHGRRKTEHSHTVAYFEFDDVDLPIIRITPKSILSRFCSSALNDVEIAPEFSSKYRVEALDSGKARRMVTGELREFLAGKKLTIEMDGNHLLVYRHNHTVHHNLLGDFLKQGLKVFLLAKQSNAAPPPPIVKTADGRLVLSRS